MASQKPGETGDKLSALLARTAIAANQQQLVSQEEPSAAEWQAFREGRLTAEQTEPLYAWLNEHPEAYERWLTEAPAASGASRWSRLQNTLLSWIAPQPMMGIAAALLLVVGVGVLISQPPMDSLNSQLVATAEQLSDQQRVELAAILEMPWEGESALGFAGADAKAWQHEYSTGLLNARQKLLQRVDIKAGVDGTGGPWQRYGELNILLTGVASRSRDIEVNWVELQAFASLSLQPEQAAAQARLQAQLVLLANEDSGRGRYQLLRELEQQRQAFAAKPVSVLPEVE